MTGEDEEKPRRRRREDARKRRARSGPSDERRSRDPIRPRPATRVASGRPTLAAQNPQPEAPAAPKPAPTRPAESIAGDRAVSFQPPGGPPYQPPPGGPPPPPPGNPYPPQGYPGPQQPWPQQQPWAPGPPPKKRGNGWKWGLGALALLVVIGVTAAVTISVTRGWRRRWRSHADWRHLRFGKRRRQGPREHHHRRSELRGVAADQRTRWLDSAEGLGRARPVDTGNGLDT